MDHLSSVQKKEILARINSFPTSGLSCRITGNICYHYKSFVGCDFKAWMQVAVFIVSPYLSPCEMECWLLLSKVFRMCYCEDLTPGRIREYETICLEFVQKTQQHMPEYSKRLKVHLLLHLVNCMEEFGPTSCYSTERYESFNGFMRAQNIYGNRQAPSRDIAKNFAVLEHLKFICSDGYISDEFKCGSGLRQLYCLPKCKHFKLSFFKRG